MSYSFQTNVTSLVAQQNLRATSTFQSSTIQQLTSGYRINSSGDDAAGLAIANGYRSSIAELTQGVRNANDGVSQLQIVDGGLSNISTILDRLKTLATQSASNTFTGDRSTLNNEYQTLVGEVNREASNINLNTGGSFNAQLSVFTGGGNNASNSQITINLSGSNNSVDATGLGIANTSVAGGGTGISSNTVRLDDTAASFLSGSGTQSFTFHAAVNGANQDITATVNGTGSGISGTAVIDSLNKQLTAYGITASIGASGTLQFGGATAFSVTTTAAGTGPVSATGTAVNTADYNVGSGTFAAFTGDTTENFNFQNAGGTYSVALTATNAPDLATTLTTLNNALAGSGISAIKAANGSDISFQSSSAFSLNETAYNAGTGTGNVFGAAGPVTVTGPVAGATGTGNALSALNSLTSAVANLGLLQGRVGAGENDLNYAVSLAQSQITSFSAAQSQIRDTDVAAQAANLTKAQVLQQSSIAALSQANSSPQALLKLFQ